MGDVSIIARRLADGHVQYGWSGNGGYFRFLGATLLDFYTEPDMVEYLFGLGEFSMLLEPYSENSSRIWRTTPTGRPHELGTTERDIFSKIAFIDYGYFYDTDQKWYYVQPGPFRIKIPLEMVAENVPEEGSGYEFDFLRDVQRAVLRKLLDDFYSGNDDFRAYALQHGYDSQRVQEILRESETDDHPVYHFWKKHRALFSYFDDWAVVRPAPDGKSIGEILLRKQEEPRRETIDW